jgi:hypothetical protein
MWTAEAADWKGYTFSPRLSCRMSTPDLRLEQVRPAESGQMGAALSLLESVRSKGDNLEIKWIKIDGVRYEYAPLPWRLAKPAEPGGIILAYGLSLQAVRKDASSPWLPASYLTLQMINAKSMTVGYELERDERRFGMKKSFSLNGFKQAAKWCGRQLLPDLKGTRFEGLAD